MLEMAIAAVFVTVAVVAIGGRGIGTAKTAGPQTLAVLEDPIDLPCPWCRAQTHEGDQQCGTCGQRFG